MPTEKGREGLVSGVNCCNSLRRHHAKIAPHIAEGLCKAKMSNTDKPRWMPCLSAMKLMEFTKLHLENQLFPLILAPFTLKMPTTNQKELLIKFQFKQFFCAVCIFATK